MKNLNEHAHQLDATTRAELDALSAMVDAFAKEMKAKLHQKCLEGYSGWRDEPLRDVIEEKLRSHVERGSGQYVDVANLAAMLWNLDTEG